MLRISWFDMPAGLHRIYGAHHLHFITKGEAGPVQVNVGWREISFGDRAA
jgi:hypothetical protein